MSLSVVTEATSTIRDVTDSWSEERGPLPGATAYHSLWWGRVIASTFGGEFRVFRLRGESSRYLPVLFGGQLAGDTFHSGAIGYGGVLRPDRVTGSLEEHRDAIAEVEHHVGIECGKLALGPEQAAPFSSDIDDPGARHTMLAPLRPDTSSQWSLWRTSVRTAVRKCLKEGMLARPLQGAEVELAASLLHATQEKVGSTFRTPPALLEKLMREPHALVLGVFFGEELVSFGVFLIGGGSSVYVFNGWNERYSELAPNYLLLAEAFRLCSRAGCQVMDLGYSHTKGLADSKRRWGAAEAPTLVLSELRP